MKKSNTGLCVRLLQFTLRSTCKCAYVCVYMLSQFRDHKDYVRSRIKIDSVVCLYTPLSPSVPEMEGTYATGGILLFFSFLSESVWPSGKALGW